MYNNIENTINEIQDIDLREELLETNKIVDETISNLKYYIIFKDYVCGTNVYELHRLKRILYKKYNDSNEHYAIYLMIEKIEDTIIHVQNCTDKINTLHNERLKVRKSV